MNDIKRRVAEIAAAGERTLVLHGGGPAGPAASRMLPKLPEVCFTGMDPSAGDDPGEAVRQAVEHGLDKVIVVATADGLPRGPLLGDITTDMGGTPALAAEVAAAGSAGRACELWRDAGMLGPCGRELCRRVADDLERVAASHVPGRRAPSSGAAPSPSPAPAGSPIAAQVVLMDDGGRQMIGMYGRLRP
jgi:cobalt-precorrin-5B (C1)-methyltransferase